jgi:hypothetical protein
MSYFIDLFSPETYEAFGRSSRDISGFRRRHKRTAERIRTGDKLACYVTRVSRWCGLLEVVEGPFVDSKPIFTAEKDPFVVRFRVRPVAWLPLDQSLPIHSDVIWKGLSFTRALEQGSTAWIGKVRGSPVRLEDADGQFLERILLGQVKAPEPFDLDEEDKKKLATHSV